MMCWDEKEIETSPTGAGEGRFSAGQRNNGAISRGPKTPQEPDLHPEPQRYNSCSYFFLAA